MMYHPIKFACKKISSAADMVEAGILDQMSPHCDPKLDDSKPIFLHDTLAHDVASPYQVWLQKFSSWADIVQMNIHWNSEPFLWT